jgi:phenylpyruvate tautomerase PptA (4-oxalocrotonate tautomerase family)
MPSATITLVGSAPTPAQRQALFQRTADLMVEVLKRTRSLVVVSLKHEQCENWSVGGSQLPNADSIGAQGGLSDP